MTKTAVFKYRILSVVGFLLGVAALAQAQAPGGGGGAGAPPPADKSECKLDAPTTKLIDATTGTTRITATGKLTLGKDDTFSGFKIEFKEPVTKNTPAPTLEEYTTPAPGETKNFKYSYVTTTKGNWSITATLEFNTKAGPNSSTDIKFVDVK